MSIGMENAATLDRPTPDPATFEIASADQLKEAGTRATHRTMELLQEQEKQNPGVVHSVIVYFRDGHNSPSLEFMLSAERNQGNRETRHSIALTHADRVQCKVREFLWHDPSARDCFVGCPHFQFEPNRLIKIFPVTNTLVVPATSRLVDKLWEYEDVVGVQANFNVKPVVGDTLTKVSRVLPLAQEGAPSAHRDGYTWGWNRLGMPAIHRQGLKGNGVTVGLVNTGVCEDHADLNFKVKEFAKVEPSGRLAPGHSFDGHGHGTHCAGIIVGANNSRTQIGGAPAAELKAVSIMDDGQAWGSSLLAALEWLSDPYRAASVINMSVGMTPYDREKDLLEAVVRRIALMGIVSVAAIGNSAGQSMYPACLANVIACGALRTNGQVWPSSGKNPDFVLPGESIYSCLPPNNPRLDGQHYGWQDGSSLACAHMSALVALFMERRPSAGPSLILRAFRETAGNSTRRDGTRGWGVPDLQRALEYKG